MKIQITKAAGEVLGIKPDKDGFYFADPQKKLSIGQLSMFTARMDIDYKVQQLKLLKHHNIIPT